MNYKLKRQYEEVKRKVLKLENDTTESINSQLEELAKKTDDGIDNFPSLTKALEEEVQLLNDASDMFERVAKKTRDSADTIHTSIKEAREYGKDLQKGKRFMNKTNAQIDYAEKIQNHFARGNTFYKLFWVFFIGCFGGVIIEEIFCLVTRGHLESRVGLIYGPFNLVYGFGALCLSGVLYPYRNRSKIYSFIGGFLVGSVVEYGCSYFQEMVFGSVSWDYSQMPFNLNGRICLLYSIFWGILGIFWIKEIYPRMAEWILKIPNKFGKILTITLLIFMIFNSIMTGLVTYRWSNRVKGIESNNAFERWADETYPNERMEKIFANLTFTDQ